MRAWLVSPLGKVLMGAAAAVVLLLFFTDLNSKLFGPAPFAPHRTCYMNDPALIWLHVSSDMLIGLAYLSISATLVYLVQKARVPFHSAFIAFGLFIGACGCTHFMEVWTVWQPHYWLAGVIKVITAAASLITAIWLYPLLPKAFSLIQATELAEERRIKLESTHKQLEVAHQQLQIAHNKTKELDQLKTDFFSNVSHELRTPLALILGPARQMLSSRSLPDQQRQSLESIERNAQLLLKHVNDLLDLSKLDARRMALNYSQADLTQVTRMTVGHFESLARERNIALTIDATETVQAQIDVEKIQRVLFNLLSNAFKFVSDKNGSIRCGIRRQGERVTISVQDNGPGVPQQYRREIFERFRQLDSGPTRSVSGTGLGLSIVKEFVQLHEGQISISDTAGGGATFTLDIPITAPAGIEVKGVIHADVGAQAEQLALSTLAELRVRQQSAGTQAPVSTNNGLPLVLVVEDNAEMSRFIAENLSNEYRVETASNGSEGLEKAVRLRPDVIVSDVMMPVKSGDLMLRELQALPDLKNTPVIMLTAKADDEMRVRLLRQGARDYMMKPILTEELLARVGNLMSLKRTRDILQTELSSTAQNLESLAKQLASRQREAHAARVTAETANRAKDEFLMTLSHELRTPLTSIFGWIRMIQVGGLKPEAVQRGMDTIERNVRLQMQLIEDLLDISRIIAGKLRLNVETIELIPIIEHALDAVQPSATTKNITLNKSLPPVGCLVSGDADRLQQAVWNLLTNAVKFTPRGGSVSISLTLTDSHAQIRVSDNGQGIAPEFFPFIFEKFRQADSSTTRSFGGLGLGLALVRHLVELHGGTVAAESAGTGSGAAFTISIPLLGLNAHEITPAQPIAMHALPKLSGMKILVVEDESDTRDLLKIILSGCGAEVFAFESAAEAMNHLQSNRPNVIISDIGLPEEDGLKFIRRVRALQVEGTSSVPAIALTAFAGEIERNEALAAGYQTHLPKPIEPAMLADAIQKLMR